MPDCPRFPGGGGQERRGGGGVADTHFGGGQIGDEVLEFIEFGQPFIGLVEVLDGGVDAGGEGFGVLGGDGVGTDEFDLLVEALLLGHDEGLVLLGLIEALLALAQDFEPFKPGAEIALLGFESGAVAAEGYRS